MKSLFKNPVLRFVTEFALLCLVSVVYAIGCAFVYFLTKLFVALFRGHF
jgi:hypothetical protein